MKKYLVFEWDKPLGNYLIRWRIDFYFFSIRLHKWLCSDDMRAYHDHPVNFFIYVIRGHYLDHYLENVNGGAIHRCKRYRTGDLRHFKRDYRHFVEVIDIPTWTLIFTYGLPRKWAFWGKHSLRRKNRDKYFLEEGHHICD